MVTVAVDVMGGDYAPGEILKGVSKALSKQPDCRVVLLGNKEVLEEGVKQYNLPMDRVELAATTQVITNEESPVKAVSGKKDSSLVAGMRLVREGKAQAFVSAGSTGAVLVGGQTIVGRIKGVLRPPLAPVIPTDKGPALLVDCGANVDAKAANLVQFARMGSIYMEKVLGIRNPRVAIVNIGAEEEKGNALVKETMPLLKEQKNLNFIGSIEAREIPGGGADVIVCDAFVGNVILKMYEGVGATLLSRIKKALTQSVLTKIGALLIKNTLKESLKDFDAKQYGGAPLLGLKGLVVKAHGNSKSGEICNSILQCVTFTRQKIKEAIEESIGGTNGV